MPDSFERATLAAIPASPTSVMISWSQDTTSSSIQCAGEVVANALAEEDDVGIEPEIEGLGVGVPRRRIRVAYLIIL